MLPKNIEELIAQAVEIEELAAKEAGTLGFMARAMVQATMPHRDPKTSVFERVNGHYHLTMMAPPSIGLPYGSIPRLLMCWITTEATRTKDRTLILGETLSSFMRELDMIPTGGRWGTITRLRDQMKRLFACSTSCFYSDKGNWSMQNINIVSKAQLWWDPQQPDQAGLWQSSLQLNEDFFREVVEHPIPIDTRVLKALKRSPMALDIYCWMTYRLSYLKTPTVIPWPLLQNQFGTGYDRIDNFKAAFIEALKKVVVMYPEAKVQPVGEGLQLRPSPVHIAR